MVEQGLKRIKSLEIIRSRIPNDFHDDLGSILSGLAMQSQIMAINDKD